MKAGRFIGCAVIAIGAVAGALIASAPAHADSPATLTVWVSPAGSDSNDGATATTPFKTLQHANDWLCGSTTGCTGRAQPVIVRIAQTTIPVTSMTNWRYYDLGYPTTLEPWSYQPGYGSAQLAATGGLPTFDGRFAADHGLAFWPAGAGSNSTRLSFLYLRWQRFNISAIDLHGGVTQKVTSTGVTVSWPTANAANGVSFYGDYFYEIGNRWQPTHPMGWAAIDAYNSSGDSVANSHCVDLENRPADAGHVHCLYLSHHSNNTVVKGNDFTSITGDVVRQRDLSDDTVVTGNVFTSAGQFGYVDDWYCVPSSPNSSCFPKEYRSWGGRFYGNTLKGLFPETAAVRRVAFCFDLAGGACPSNRWSVTG